MTSRNTVVPAWATITVLSLCGVVSSLQFTLIIPSLPDLPARLGVSADDASWLVTATLLTSAVSTPIVARMADMYGKRKMLILSLVAMVLGSVICAVFQSFAIMLVGRALQGFASSLVAVGISILRDELPPERITFAVALMSATLGIGAALGLPLSGILTDVFGWHSVFWFSALAGGLLTVGLSFLVRESQVRTRGRFDIAGALLLSVVLVALLLPVTKGGTWGWSSPAVLGLAALGVLALAGWIPLELRVRQPMVDLRTATRRPILLTNIASVFVGMAMFINLLVTTQILQQPEATGFGLGMSVFATGVAMVPSGLMMVLLSPVSGALLSRWGGRPTLMLGCSIMAVTYAGRVYFSNNLAEVMIGSTLVGMGTALAFAAAPTLIMESVPVTETTSANGLNTLVRSIGTSIGSAVVALVVSTRVLEIDGVAYPAEAAVHTVLWIGMAATTVAIALICFVPRSRTRHPAGQRSQTGADGQVLAAVALTTRSTR